MAATGLFLLPARILNPSGTRLIRSPWLIQACNLAVLPGTLIVGAGVIFFGWTGVAFGGAMAIGLTGLAYRFGLPYAARILEYREPELLAALVKRAD